MRSIHCQCPLGNAWFISLLSWSALIPHGSLLWTFWDSVPTEHIKREKQSRVSGQNLGSLRLSPWAAGTLAECSATLGNDCQKTQEPQSCSINFLWAVKRDLHTNEIISQEKKCWHRFLLNSSPLISFGYKVGFLWFLSQRATCIWFCLTKHSLCILESVNSYVFKTSNMCWIPIAYQASVRDLNYQNEKGMALPLERSRNVDRS